MLTQGIRISIDAMAWAMAASTSASGASASESPRLIAEVEIPHPSWTTNWSAPAWSADGKRIFVERSVDSRWFPWLDEFRSEIGGVTVALGLAISIWWLVRTLRRPRLPGRRYCRRCNHDLNADASAPADGTRCSECGVVLTPRRVAVGRRLWRRLTTGLVPALALVCLGFSRMHGVVVMHPVPHPTGQQVAWPVAALDAVRGWPLWRKWRPSPSRPRLDVYELTEKGEVVRVGDVLMHHSYGRGKWLASRDGRIVAWSQFSDANDWNLELHWCDVDARRSRSVVVGGPGGGFIRACGFTPDDRGIVIRIDRPVDAVAHRANTTRAAHHVVELLVVGADSGAVRRVAASEAFAVAESGTGGRSWRIEPGIGAVGAGPSIEWATATLQHPPARLAYVMVGGSDGVRRVELSAHWLSQLWGLRAAEIRGDRWLVVTGDRGVPYEVDLVTGSVQPAVVPDALAWRGMMMSVSPQADHAATVVARHRSEGRSQGAANDEQPDALLLRVWRR